MDAQEGSLVALEDTALEGAVGGLGSPVAPDLRIGAVFAGFFSQLTGTPYVPPKGTLGLGGLFGL